MIALLLASLLSAATASRPAFAPAVGCASSRQEIKSDDVVATLETRYQKVAQKVGPAIVAIRVEREPEASEKKPSEPRRPRRLPQGGPMIEPPDLFATRPADFWCSGTVVESDGLVATTAFNVSGKVKSITVRLADGRELEGKILGVNGSDDLALLKIDAKDLPTLAPSHIEDLHAGCAVMAIGRAPDGKSLTLNPGIVSAVSRMAGRGIQHDARLNFGNVGGPLVDCEGRLIAITCKVNTRSGISSTLGQNSGVGYAVTNEELKKILPDLKNGKSVAEARRPALGVYQADLKNATVSGAAIGQVVAGGAAERAGIQKGDVVIEMDGQKVSYFDELRALILRKAPGDRVKLKVMREEKELEFEVELGWAPED
jgi:S1-C subfamily serine protease